MLRFLFSFITSLAGWLALTLHRLLTILHGYLTPKPGFHYFAPRMAYFSFPLSHGRLFYFMYNVLYSLLPSIARTTYHLYLS